MLSGPSLGDARFRSYAVVRETGSVLVNEWSGIGWVFLHGVRHTESDLTYLAAETANAPDRAVEYLDGAVGMYELHGFPLPCFWCPIGLVGDRMEGTNHAVNLQANRRFGGLPLRSVLPYGIVPSALAINTALFASLCAIAHLLPGVTIRLIRRARAQCPSCGYVLVSDGPPGCPECGWNREEARDRRSDITDQKE